MKRLVIIVIVVLVALSAVYYLRPRSRSETPASPTVSSPPTIPASNAIGPDLPAASDVYVEIEEGKTIDFSSGTPQIRNNSADDAALAAALAEMEAATAEISAFAPTTDR